MRNRHRWHRESTRRETIRTNNHTCSNQLQEAHSASKLVPNKLHPFPISVVIYNGFAKLRGSTSITASMRSGRAEERMQMPIL